MPTTDVPKTSNKKTETDDTKTSAAGGVKDLAARVGRLETLLGTHLGIAVPSPEEVAAEEEANEQLAKDAAEQEKADAKQAEEQEKAEAKALADLEKANEKAAAQA